MFGPEPTDDNPLWKYFLSNRGREIHKWHHYFNIYHHHFRRFRNLPVTVLEIGVAQGGSLQMWKDYFGPKARIFGADIKPRCRECEEEQIRVFIGDQSNRKFLRDVREKIGKIDILIDDGGHRGPQQVITFEELYPAINANGIYLIEDLQTSYSESHLGKDQGQNSFIEYAKGLIDQLNAWPSRGAELTPSDFTKSAVGLHFYLNVFVIEKHPILSGPEHSRKGKTSF